MSLIRKAIAMALSLCLIFTFTIGAALAYKDYRAEVLIDDCAIFGYSYVNGSPYAELFRNSNQYIEDNEYFNMYFSNDTGAEICDQPLAMANFVQQSDQKGYEDYTGQFFCSYNYVWYDNPGSEFFSGTSGGLGLYRPLSSGSVIGSGYLFPEMIGIDPGTYNVNKISDPGKMEDGKKSKANDTSMQDKSIINTKVIFDNSTINNSANRSLNKSINASKNASAKKKPGEIMDPVPAFIADPFWDLRSYSKPNGWHTCDLLRKTKPEQIRNMSSLERLYWSSFYTTKMDYAFGNVTGMMSHPNWIVPQEDAYSVVPMSQMNKCINHSLNETLMTGQIQRRLWDL
jgi:hypothetical protein